MNMIIVWAAVSVICIVVELATYGITSIWFAIGGLCALLAAALGAPTWLQGVWFVLISVVTLVLTRPLVRKYINGKTQPTNADRVIGTRAVVREEIDDLAGTGTVFADGKLWSAQSAGGEKIAAGETVRIEEIRGVKLIVRKETGSKEE